MSCFTKSVVFQVRIGEVVAYPIRFVGMDLSYPNTQLIAHLVTGQNVLVQVLEFELLDQVLNIGIALLRFKADEWSQTLVGQVLKLDVLLRVNNSNTPDTIFSTGTMYVEVLESPTFQTLGA